MEANAHDTETLQLPCYEKRISTWINMSRPHFGARAKITRSKACRILSMQGALNREANYERLRCFIHKATEVPHVRVF